MNLYTISTGWGICFFLAIVAAVAGVVVPIFSAWFLFISLVGLATMIYQAYLTKSQNDTRVFSSDFGWTWMLGICFFYFQMCFLHWTEFDSPVELFTRLAPGDSWPAILTRTTLCISAIILMLCTRIAAASFARRRAT